MKERPDYLTNELMPRCPITTADEALIWIASEQGAITFIALLCQVSARDTTGSWKVGFGGYDARGALLMAARELWFRIHREQKL